jgi:hypothetical protein
VQIVDGNRLAEFGLEGGQNFGGRAIAVELL